MSYIKSLSIVMPYCNRRQLLLNTLKSIDYFRGEHPIEIIIIDDGSNEDQQINDVPTIFPGLDFNIIMLERNRAHTTPVIAYNTGFNAAQGDAVLINCAESLHAGKIIDYIFDNLTPNYYLNFSAYMSDNELNKECDDIRWDTENPLQSILGKIESNPDKVWGCHSSMGNFIPYCGVINTSDLELLSGYDERFSNGIGWDDYDFTDRINNIGVKSVAIDSPFCIHQYHKPTVYANYLNLDFLSRLRADFPNRIKPPNNEIYVR